MKSFLKTTLAVIVGIVVTSLIGFVLCVVFITSAISSAAPSGTVPSNAVLKIDMSRIRLAEQSQETLPSLQGNVEMNPPAIIGIWDAVSSIKEAADDPDVKFIYLKTDAVSAPAASLQEFRSALQKFRESGKSVVAYIESPSTAGYYLASVADRVYMTSAHGATAEVLGVSGRMVFLKDLLDKFGVNMQLIRHGKYKSAGEMFVKNEPSAENLEQTSRMITSVWESFSEQIAASRGISVEELNSCIDDLKLCVPEDFVENKLVDELLDRQSLEQKIADLAMQASFKDVKMAAFSDYVLSRTGRRGRAKNKIAILFADGEIVDGYDPRNVSSDKFVREIVKIRNDSTIKAVVLRVNSPGGSVLASEKIKAELDLLQKDKPVVASYGDYAASGGYWISNASDRVFADPVTLTGSIGVFGMVPDFSGTLKNVAHINLRSVNSNRHGDMFSLTRPFDADEYAYMVRSIEDIYGRFLDNVSAGRDLPREKVDEIGQGRVWTGSDALSIGLVDELGGLEDALAYAAASAGNADLSGWSVESYPKPLSAWQQLFQSYTDDTNEVRWARSLAKPQVLARMPYLYVIE